RPRHFAPGRRPQGRGRLRLPLDCRRRRSAPSRLHPPDGVHILKGPHHVLRKILTGSLMASLLTGTALADTLREALVSAYQTNPTLTAQRENLKVTDANVAIAKAAGRPQVSGTVGLNRDLSRSGILSQTSGHGPTVSGGVDLSYPLFNGGSVKNSVRAAETRVEAGRATLRAVEGDVFTQAVAAYMDVIR